MRRHRSASLVAGVLILVLALGTLPGRALAHGGSLGGGHLSVSRSLAAGTGGLVVGASLAVAALRAERGGLDVLFGVRRQLPLPGGRPLRLAAQALGVLVLAGVLVVGFLGPSDPVSNAAVVLVWGGWWAGYAMSTYLAGNTWPGVDPWRTVAAPLARRTRTSRWRWGAWPSVAALLALFWLQVVSPLATRPRALATVVAAYSVVTVAGAIVYGPGVWFAEVDPVARAFRFYGLVAPLGRDGDGVVFRAPGSALSEDVLVGADDAAFAVALLWAPLFEGFVTTPLWNRLARVAVGWGIPPTALYPLALCTGFVLCWGAFLLASRVAARTVSGAGVPALARRFAPSALAVAAGYHFAHFLDYFLSLVPALALAVTAPFATVDPGLLVLPDWLGVLTVGGVLAGHVLGTLAVRTVALDVGSEGDATRSQYPFGAVLVGYSFLALWVVTRPELTPPFVGA
ncbi:MAG: hypothetical protein V5A44_07230 [Haloarculaceae archaeon]